jgi:hypothetical protein
MTTRLWWEFTDFIEEDCSSVGRFEASETPLKCSCE